MTDTRTDGTTTALATIGTVCWCIQLIPQIIRNWYVRDCEGVPPAMFFLFAASGVPFAIYFFVQDANTVLIVQPYLFTFFSLIGFWQSLYYPPVSFSRAKSTLILAALTGVSAGIEVGCIIPLRHLYREGTKWPNLIPGIIAAVLLGVGLLPPYWELFKRQGRVVGINFVFLVLDSSGAVFSTASVGVQKGHLDVLGIVLYLIVLCLELGIMTSHGIWAIRVRYFGLLVDDGDDVELADDDLHNDSGNVSVTEPLRAFVRERIVHPLARCVLRLRKDLKRPAAVPEDTESQIEKTDSKRLRRDTREVE